MPRDVKQDVMNGLRRAQTEGLARVNPHTGYAAFLPGSSEPETPPSDQPQTQSEGPAPGQPQASTEVPPQSSGQDQVESQPTHDSIEKNQPMGQTA